VHITRSSESPDGRRLSARLRLGSRLTRGSLLTNEARQRQRTVRKRRQIIQIAANMMPIGTLILASVPLPPHVYRELRRQAVVSKKTTSELMTAILTGAVGK
jgi:hypothetical protein